MSGWRAVAGVVGTVWATASAAAVGCQPVAPGEIFISPITSPGKISPFDGTCFINDLKLVTVDGFKLVANVFLPKITSPGQKFPTIVMVNSWSLPEWEYTGQAQRLAKDGYIVYEYASRGWWRSEGQTRVAGPEEIRDISTIVDWLLANTPAHPDKLAISGLSYGGGVALLGLAREPRLKTAVALSPWANLYDDLYENDSANQANMALLLTVGKVTGSVADEVTQIRNDLVNPNITKQRADEIHAWADLRSPQSELAALNARNAPVFISKNYSDEMFTPNSTLRLFSQLHVPKKLVLSNGWHAEAELPGALTGLPNHAYDQAHRWFDYWLKGIDNGIMNEPQLDMAIQNASGREKLATWPDATVKTKQYAIAPRGPLRFDASCFCAKGWTGGLKTSASSEEAVDTINNAFDTVATTGIPIVSELLTGTVSAFPLASLPFVLRDQGVVYNGPALSSTMKVRGVPQVKLIVRPNKSQAQVVAYLYDVDALGIGKLITHGVRTLHWANPGQAISFPLDLHMTSYNVPAGHHLSLVLDTQDLHYAPASYGSFNVDFVFTAGQPSSLTVPYIN